MSVLLNVGGLTEDEFLYFKEVVYHEAGIKLSPLKKALLQSRIMRRIRFLQLSSFNEYKFYLEQNYDAEITHFINVITTNKTEFMREKRHFEFMFKQALPEFTSRGEKELRIWSAGCSTGEEPYSIAISCLEYFGLESDIKLKILATDIDTQVLETGVIGTYPFKNVEIFDKRIIQKYFIKDKFLTGNDEAVTASDELKNKIFFRKLNLLDPVFPMKKKFFIIFCRNVIIYFDRETQQKLFAKIYEHLDEDGYLFIGHSENLSSVSTQFKSIGHTIYTKNDYQN